MATLKPEVKAVLDASATNVTYQYPASWATMPAVSWYEANNRDAGRADGEEHETELAYVIDIWDLSQGLVDTAYEAINTGIKALGFRREFAYDIPGDPSGYRHKTTRYRAILTGSKIHQ
jgi:hypothetical protein